MLQLAFRRHCWLPSRYCAHRRRLWDRLCAWYIRDIHKLFILFVVVVAVEIYENKMYMRHHEMTMCVQHRAFIPIKAFSLPLIFKVCSYSVMYTRRTPRDWIMHSTQLQLWLRHRISKQQQRTRVVSSFQTQNLCQASTELWRSFQLSRHIQLRRSLCTLPATIFHIS